MQAQVQEVPIGHVAASVHDDLPVRVVVLVLQELEFEQQQRLDGRTPLIVAVGRGQNGTETLEVDYVLDPAEIMILRYRCFKNLLVSFVWRQVIWFRRKHLTKASWRMT